MVVEIVVTVILRGLEVAVSVSVQERKDEAGRLLRWL